MFKPSQKCRIPHLNADVLRDDLFQTNFIKRHQIKSTSDLKNKLLLVNSTYAQQTDDALLQLMLKETGSVSSESKTISQAIKKARQFNFFLGLTSAWIRQ